MIVAVVFRKEKTSEPLWPKSLYFGYDRQDILVEDES